MGDLIYRDAAKDAVYLESFTGGEQEWSETLERIDRIPAVKSKGMPMNQGKLLDVSFSVGVYHGDTKDTESIELTITTGKCRECGLYSCNLMQCGRKMLGNFIGG